MKRIGNHRYVAAALVAAALIAPASALATAPSAHIPLKVNPATPIVDDSVTVSFRVVMPLKPGWHYEATLVGDPDDGCAWLVNKQGYSKRGKGKVVSFRFDPYDDTMHEAGEWCQGKASVLIYKAKKGVEGPTVGLTGFRFYAKP